MAIKARKTNIESAPAGNHFARVVQLLDLDLQPGYMYQQEMIEPQYKVMITYELVGCPMSDGRPFLISEEMKSSTHERSKMYSRLKSLDPQGTRTNRGENLIELLNTPCMVDVTHSDKGYANVSGVSSVPSSITVPELTNTPVAFDWEEPNAAVYNAFPDYIKNKLRASLNFEGSPLHKIVAMSDTSSDTGY